ncbi:MAG: 3-methyladenine DNA glycosylase 2, partial [Acidobacteriota bacterium]
VDPFECAVRVLLGQQVTVKGATTLTGRLVERFGGKTVCAGGRLTHVFPRAEALVEADLGGVGLPKARAQALHALARAVAEGSVDLSPLSDRARTRRALEAVRGIGPWTADVIALRALHDPDVFPAGDLGLRRAAGAEVSEAQLRRRAEAWAPWRSYAALLLWRAAATESTTN